MRTCVVIPGLFGSRLETPDGRPIWPPRPSEFLRGELRSRRAARLLDPDLRPAGVLDWFACRDVYDGLLRLARAAGYAPGESSARRLAVFAYDWRCDLFDSAMALAREIDRLDRPGERFLLLAHSMGGLLARLMLEDAAPAPWRERIELFAAFGTPHAGAPATLARLSGALGGMGFSAAQTRTLAADPRFPGPAQLLPPPGAACVIGSGGLVIDAYAEPLGLPRAGLDAARRLHAALAAGRRPARTRYLFIAGAGEDTVLRCRQGRTGLIPLREPGGDGAVPLWSAAPPEVESWVVEAAHADLFRERSVIARLAPLLGAARQSRAGARVSRLSIPDEPIRPGARFALRLFFARPVTRFRDRLILSPLGRGPRPGVERSLFYEGPPVRRLDLEAQAPGRPGFHAAGLQRHRLGDAATPILAVAPAG
jgi:hypothetical protein